jgi:hypothetical protein
MQMRAFGLSIVLSLAMATAALAVGAGWHGPGWYVVMNTPVKQNSLYRGSYKTRDDCLADKPADHGAVEYDCVQFDHEPLDE